MLRTPDASNEQLFLHNPATGQEIVSQVALPEVQTAASVGIVDRNIHLLSALAIFGELNSYGTFGKALYTERRAAIEAHYGGKAQFIASSIEKGRLKARREARRSFERAAGLGQMIDAVATTDDEGSMRNPLDVRRDVRGLQARMSHFFVRFQKKYDGPQNTEARETFQSTLLDNLRYLQGEHTISNRDQGLRPHKTPKRRSPTERAVDQPLGTRERLRPIKGDIRAGFLPSTHREKNKVLEDLDYLDNPKYVLGPLNRQLEIFNHNARLEGSGVPMPDGPERAALSLAYELLDYFYDARESLILLRSLDEDMHQKPDDLLNPTLKVGLTSFGDNHKEALVRVLRHLDIEAYADGFPTRVNKDPLRTQEDRWKESGPGIHKRVYDYYVKPRDQLQQLKIDEAVKSLTVKELRDTVPVAIVDQTKRVIFFAERIQEIAEKLYQRTFKDTRDVALVALGSIEIEFLPHAA